MELNSDQIQEILPHRYPFAMVDRITDYEPGAWARGIKCVSVNEMQFMGHFPQKHVMPGVLVIEALSQVGAIAILTKEGNSGKLVLFGGIKKARFRQQITPGDVIELYCEMTAVKGPIGFGKAEAKVNGKTAVTAELSFAITS